MSLEQLNSFLLMTPWKHFLCVFVTFVCVSRALQLAADQRRAVTELPDDFDRLLLGTETDEPEPTYNPWPDY